MFFVYIIVSEINGLRFYVGMTANIDTRLKEHNSGKTKSTKGYIPWSLFFYETFKTRQEARGREIYYKSGTGKEKIKRKWQKRSKILFVDLESYI
ncbi:MAG: GIY-YIG nuclease family protein [Bacteroidia bacterium]|nr:GIY-YIG nuclease family protein [Bacteroidia bacterium]